MENENKTHKHSTSCSICNYTIPSKETFVTANNIVICQKCAERAYFALNLDLFTNLDHKKNEINKLLFGNSKKVEKEEVNTHFDLYPQEIYNLLEDYIIGQEETKKIISVGLFQHLQKIKMSENKTDFDKDRELEKSNILLIGESGSGKTLIAKTISKILGVPLVITDATSLTARGYLGNDVDDILIGLVNKAEGNIELAQKGIVFIDEIDKISAKEARNGSGRDINGQSVQESLLKMIEGHKVPLKLNQNQINARNEELDTSNILFIFGGAFSGLDKLIEQEKKQKISMGFVTSDEEAIINEKNITDYLIEYGFSPEFLGRIPVVSKLNKLTEQDLIDIISKPKNSILSQYKYFFENNNISITLSEDCILEIVSLIKNNKIGARALKSIFSHLFNEIIFNISEFKNKELIITKEFIKTKDLKTLETSAIENNETKIAITA